MRFPSKIQYLFAILFSITVASSFIPPLANGNDHSRQYSNTSIRKRGDDGANCTVKQYWEPKYPEPMDWVDNSVDAWLDTWFTTHAEKIANLGFANAWGLWALGTPDFTCHFDGSPSNCDFEASCDIQALNAKGEEDIRQAYYVTEAVTRLHSYFVGLREAFETASISAAFSKDTWVKHFNGNQGKDVSELRDFLTAAQTVFGVGAAVASLAGPYEGAAAAGLNSLFAGVNGILLPHLAGGPDTTFEDAAGLGTTLGNIARATSESFIDMNNILMQGGDFLQTGDIRSYLMGGLWVNFPGIEESPMIESMNNLLIGHAINYVWRHQMIYIIGGGRCGDGQGIGSGPSEGCYCRESDNTAWYLYHWQRGHGSGDSRYGKVQHPHGMWKLGSADYDYSGVQVTDIIKSSLQSFETFEYTPRSPKDAMDRARILLEDDMNPLKTGPSFEGVFTIPVCNLSQAANTDDEDPTYYMRQYMLTPYSTDDKEERQWWCGPVCDGDINRTRRFIEAANMHSFDSFHYNCEHGHGPETEDFPPLDGWSGDPPLAPYPNNQWS